MSAKRIGFLTDHYGVEQYLAPNGEVCAVPLFKLVGDIFFDSVLDTRKWTASIGTGGSAAATGGQLVMQTGTTANNSVSVASAHNGRFLGLAPNKCRIPLQCPDGGTANNTRRWGVFTTTDGAFFELSGTTFRCVTRKASVDSVISSFNGQFGPTFTMGTGSHFFEIIYQPRQVVFLADNKIVHTFAATAATWAETLHLPLRMENTNSNGSTTNVELQVRLAVIARFGIPESRQYGVFQSGTTAGIVVKYGPGNLHNLTISNVSNNAVITLYDNTAASGTILFSTGTMGSQTTPISLDMGSVYFDAGLTLVISGAAANALVIYD